MLFDMAELMSRTHWRTVLSEKLRPGSIAYMLQAPAIFAAERRRPCGRMFGGRGGGGPAHPRPVGRTGPDGDGAQRDRRPARAAGDPGGPYAAVPGEVRL
jgi:hypothetical protein